MMDSEHLQQPRSYAPMDPEFHCAEGFDGVKLTVHSREHPDAVAAFAMELLRTNGVLMGDENGEDSSGRAKLRPMAPAVLVQRAFDIAERVYELARATGHMLLLPTAAEIEQTAIAERDRRTAEKDERDTRRRAEREAALKAPADA